MLYSGQTAVFDKIPVGVHYNVTETEVEGYISKSTGNQGNITQDESVASFVNRYITEKCGSLTVSKEVIGEGADLNKEFRFTATFDGVSETFTLKHGESKTFNNLPLGTEYTITEEALADGYSATVEEYTGRIVSSEVVSLPFVNIYKTEPKDEFGSLTINKTVTGENADPNKEFTFTVVFSGENAPKGETFKLKAGETRIFENISNGVTYTVTETDNAGYHPVTDTAQGTIVGNYVSEVKFINRVPEKDKTKLTVTKVLAGEVPDSDKQKEFEFTLIINGEKTEFTLKANESSEFEIPMGALYELHEADYFAEGFSQSVTNGFGIAGSQPINITVTNTYIGEPKVEIKGSKKWEMSNHTEVKLPETITVQLKNKDLLVEEKTVTPNEKGEWKYTFTAPKYNSDGSMAVYTVEELPITSYKVSYNGYDITNTYIAPVTVDLPTINKVVQGENAPATEFQFVLKGATDAPMPKDSEGN